MQKEQFAVGSVTTAGRRAVRWLAAACFSLALVETPVRAAANEFQLSAATYVVQENFPGFVSIPVLYTGGATNAVDVQVATSGGTPGRYIPATNTLTFNPGEQTNTFTVLITEDTATNGNNVFTVTLSNPGGGATIGVPSVASVTILDNETPGFAPPANDNFTNALVIAGVAGNVGTARTNTFGTKETGEPNHASDTGGASVWFRWTAPVSGTVTFTTAGAGFDTVLGVYTGTAVDVLTPVAVDDNSGPGTTSAAMFTAVAGTVYRIAIDGAGGAVGTYQLSWTIAGNAGTFGFTRPQYLTSELDGGFGAVHVDLLRSFNGYRIPIARSGGTAGKVIVHYRVSDGTAIRAANHYSVPGATIESATSVTNSAVFFDGQARAGFFIVPNPSAANNSNNISVNITILNVIRAPGESGLITAPALNPIAASCQLGIIDSTLGPCLERRNFRVDKYAGGFTVRLLRNGAGDGSQTDWSIEEIPTGQLEAGSDHAVAHNDNPLAQTTGTNFTAATGAHTWTGTETFFDIPVTVFDPRRIQFDKDFRIVLSDTVHPRNNLGIITICTDDRVAGDHPAGAVDPAWNRDYFAGTLPPNNPTPGANAPVMAVAVQANRQTVIGGEFTSVNSTPRNRIARMNADGSLDTGFDPGTGANGSVNAIELQSDGRVLIGGVFSSFSGILRGGIARLNTNGTLDASFNPGVGANGAVRALAVYAGGAFQGKVIVAGDFTAFAGANVNRIVRLNADGSIDNSFNVGSGVNGTIYSVEIQLDGRVVLAGNFTSVNGVTRNRIARLTTTGALDSSFDPGTGADGIIYAVGLDRGAIALSNIVVAVNRQASGGAAEDIFDVNFGAGPPGTTFNGALTVNYDFLTVPDYMNVYLGTNQSASNLIFQTGVISGFNTVTIPFGPTTNRVIRIVMNEGNNTNFGTLWFYDATLLANSLGEIPAGAEKIIIGGEFNSYDSRERAKIARLEPDGRLDVDFDIGTGADDSVLTIAMDANSQAVIGGLFTSFSGTRRVGIGRLLTTGPLDTSFMDSAYNMFAGVITTNSPFSQPRNSVRSVGIDSLGGVLIGGSFRHVGGGGGTGDRTSNGGNGRNTPAGGLSSPWGANVPTPDYATRDDIRNRFNVARLIGNSTPGPGNLGFSQTEYSVDEFAGSAFLTLVRANGSLGAATTAFATGDRPAGPGAASASIDYAPTLRTPLWPSLGFPASTAVTGANNLSVTTLDDVVVTVADDGFVEGNELLNLSLDVPRSVVILGGEDVPIGVALGRSRATLNIVDDDPEPTFIGFATNRFTVDEGAGSATITVVRSGNLAQVVSVDFQTFSGAAVDGADFNAVVGSITFGAGETNRTFQIPVIDDPLAELDENFSVILTNLGVAARFTSGGDASVVTIFDNDFATGQLRFRETAYVVAENARVLTVTVERTGGNVGALTADVLTVAGSATSPADYAGVTNTLSWADGDTSRRSINIPLVSDGSVEGTESFAVQIINARVVATGNAVPVAGANPVPVTLVDSDAYGTLQFSGPTFAVSENGGVALITVTRANGSSGTVSANFATADGTATNGIQYLATNGTVILGPGVTSTNFAVRVLDDQAQNAGPNFNRTLVLSLNSFTNATPGSPIVALLTIVDDENVNEPAGSVDTVFNASAGANGFIYSLVLQPDGRLLIGGDFSTFNGIGRRRLARLDASGNLDTVFNPPNGASDSVRALLAQPDGRIVVGGFFTNVAGITRNRISRLNVDGTTDTSFEPGAGADGPVFALARHTDPTNAGKIIVAGSFAAVDAVTRPFVARLNLNGSVDTSFNTGRGPNATIFAAAVQPDGRVLIGGDFTAVDGQSAPRLARLLANGTLDAAFTANLGAGFADSVRAVLVQTDGRILVGGLFTNYNGTAVRRIVRVNANGTLDPTFGPNVDPTAGADNSVLALALQPDGKIIVTGDFQHFSGVTRGRVTRLNPNGTIDPSINFGTGANSFVAAALVQPSDGRIVIGGGFTSFNGLARNYLARLYGGVIAGAGRVEFLSPVYSVSESATNAVVTVRRIGGTAGSITAGYATANGTATAGLDYVGDTNTLSFINGEVLATISVPLIPDSAVEGNETVALALSTNLSSGTTLGNQPVATLTIIDDDSFVSFSSASYNINEAAAAGVAPITLVRSGGTNGTFSVTLVSSNGTATTGLDYVAVSNIVTFLPGDLSKTVNVPILDDLLAEGDETVLLHLVNLVGSASLASPADATLTIVENDFFPGRLSFAAAAFTVDENATNALITVVRTNGSSGSVTVNFSTANGTALAGSDYVATNGALVFADGETNKTFAVRILTDTLIESNETALLTLSAATGGATITGPNPVPLTILNNNEFIFGNFRFSSAAFSASEGSGSATITVIRTGGSTGTNSVDFATSDGSATAGADYLATNGTLVFLPGETNKTFTIPVLTDNLVESNETVNVVISNAVGGASVAFPDAAVLTIINTNTRPGDFTFLSPVFSGVENAGPVTITVLRTNGASGNVSVNVRVTDGTATAGVDYVGTNGSVVTLNWADGDNTPQTFTLTPIDDPFVEAPETVFLTLENPAGSAGTPAISSPNATFVLIDNEVPAGSVDTTFPASANGIIYGVARDDINTKIVAGGDFTELNGFARPNVGRFNPDGTLDGFASSGLSRAGGSPTVRAVAVIGAGPLAGKVVVAGQFDSVGGQPRLNVARLNTDGSLDTNFNTAIGPNGIVHAIVAQNDGSVYIGGGFTLVGTNARPFVARLAADGSLDPNFNPGAGPNDTVRALALQLDGRLVLGGDFTQVGGVPNGRVARLDGTGAVDAAFAFGTGTGADGRVYALVSGGDGRVVIGGSFSNFNGVAAGRLARLNVDGTRDGGFNVPGNGFNDSVLAVAFDNDGRLLVGGAFTGVGSLPLNRLARLTTNGAVDVSINTGTGADNFVDTITVQADDKIVIGGGFTTFNGLSAPFIARLNGGENLGNGVLELAAQSFSVAEFSPNIVVTVVRLGGASNTVTVPFATADLSALNGQDYTATSGLLTFQPGETFRTFTVAIIDDAALETNEQFSVQLGTPGGGATVGAVTNATVEILEDDAVIGLAGPVFAANENSGFGVVTVIRSGGTAGTATVEFSTTTNGTATVIDDFAPTNGVITFAPGESNRTFQVALVNDALIEGNETVDLVLSNAVGAAVLGLTNAVLNIVDDDVAAGLISIEFASYAVDEAAGSISINLVRTNGSLGAVSARFTASTGTAVAGLDFVGVGVNVAFADGEMFKTVNVQILEDLLVEGDEIVNLTLSNPQGGVALGPITNASLTILDNDTGVQFTAPTFTVDETAGVVAITVQRFGNTNFTATVDFATTASGTAIAGADFLPASGTLTFLPGETLQIFNVAILDDVFIEGTETVGLALSNPGGAFLGPLSVSQIDIIDNDSVVNFTSATYTVNETGTNALITLVRSGNLDFAATVTYAVNSGTASNNIDFIGLTNTVSFAVGETNQSFIVPIIDDTAIEGSETVLLSLIGATGGSSLGGLTNAVLTIEDDDTAGTISFELSAYSFSESNVFAAITVIRTSGVGGLVSVNVSTADGTAISTGTNADYVATNGVVVFNPGETNKTFLVRLIDDLRIESDETVRLTLSNPAGGAALGSITAATLTILNDDFSGTFVLATNNFTVTEGTPFATITVSRVGGVAGAASVNFAATAGTASVGADFTQTSGTLNWADGDGADKTFQVAIANDSFGEDNETVILTLSNPAGGVTLGTPSTGTLTIVDDDRSVAFSSASFTANEAAGVANITIRRLGVASGAVSVSFATISGTATAGVDFTNTSGSLSWADGDLSPKNFNIPINNDALVEGDETVLLVLSNAAGATLAAPFEAVVTIVDDDSSSTFVPAGARLISETGGVTNGVIDPGETVQMGLAIRNVSALNSVNLVGTLQSGNGVTNPGPAQAYGAVPAGGPAVERTFTFTATAPASGPLTAVLQLQDGAVNHGAVPFVFNLGSRTNKFSNTNAIVINDDAVASPYPSAINVSGIVGTVSKITVTLSNLTHSFPADVDVLLVSPTGQRVILLSDTGSSAGAPNGVTNVTLTFDDAAPALGQTNQIVSGTNRPTNFSPAEFFPAPAPSGPFSATLAAFNGANPNGTWSLFIIDDNFIDSGAISGGWCLNIIEAQRINPPGDLAVSVTDSPDPVVASQNVTYTINVSNVSSATANNVVVTNTLSSGLATVSISNAHGSVFQTGNTSIFQLGSLAAGTSKSVTVVAATAAPGTVSDTATVTSSFADAAPANNAATATTTVFDAADVGLTLTDTPDPVAVGSNLVYELVITNRGPTAATGVALANTLPTGAIFVSAAPSQGTWSQASGVVSVNLGSLAANAGATVTIIVQPTAPGTITNAAVVSAVQADLNPSDNAASVKTTVISAPSLSQKVSGGGIEFSWPASSPGFELVYTISFAPPVTWVPVAGTPVVVGDKYVLTMPVDPAAPTCFFRLRLAP